VSLRSTRQPPSLKQGDAIAVIAPAGAFDPQKLEIGKQIWLDHGFQIRLEPENFIIQQYLAGSDQQRADLINRALADEQIKALVCARGGYGTMRLLDRLELHRLDGQPKIIIGFSDATALLSAVWTQCRLITFSGPMIAGEQIARLNYDDQNEYFSILAGETPPPLTSERASYLAEGQAEGALLGGNLTMLCHLAAAGRLPSLDGAVLLIEDIHEAPYRIDRSLTALRLGGHLDGIAGIACGSFGPKINDETLHWILRQCLGDLSVPIITGLPLGHDDSNRLVPLGAEVVIDGKLPGVQFLQSGTC